MGYLATASATPCSCGRFVGADVIARECWSVAGAQSGVRPLRRGRAGGSGAVLLLGGRRRHLGMDDGLQPCPAGSQRGPPARPGTPASLALIPGRHQHEQTQISPAPLEGWLGPRTVLRQLARKSILVVRPGELALQQLRRELRWAA